ncbi:hypothetical protein EIP86_007948 [Pleurotus ostreatoroseus]|nr:hypothetical protein EIP86_007948 [Pleurotus ostreatoroseus]
MVSASLSVAQYRSPAGGCGHWAFALTVKTDQDTEITILQITNTRTGLFEFKELTDVKPASSDRYIRSVQITDIDSKASIENVKKLIRGQTIHNDKAQWSCQDWVIECLDTLHEEDELDDYQYGEVKEILENDYRHF